MNPEYVFITGASRGIGRSTAIYFAERGCHVFLNCRHSVEKLHEIKAQIETSGKGACTLLPGDVSDPDAVRDMFRQIRKRCRSLDILINNAGVAHIGLLMDMSDEEWAQVINTNLSSVFYCCREAVPAMIAGKSGKIVNISSIWGVSGASCEAAYSASKSGVNGLTKALAKELAPSNIQVNAIAFGVIDTEMNRQLDEEERKNLEDEIPAGRFGTVDEAAQMIWDVAHAPGYMTGQVVGFDGGF